jgi:predicted permease
MKLLKNLLALFRPEKHERDLDDELRFHLEKQVEANVAAGMSQEEAGRHALIEFGGVQQTREQVDETRWTHFAEVLLQDARYARRLLLKDPRFTCVVILTLALGIGLNTGIFSMIDAVLFRALPAKDPDQLVLVGYHAKHRPKTHMQWGYGYCQQKRLENDWRGCSLSLPWLKAVRAANVFSGVAAFAGTDRITLSGNGPAAIINSAQFVSGDFFQTLGIRPLIGRTIMPEDDSHQAIPAVMVGYGYWQSAFGGSNSVVGRTVRLNGLPFTIIGVAEKSFEGLVPGSHVDIYIPLSSRSRLTQRWTPDQEDAGAWWLSFVGRLKPEIPVKQAEAALTLLFRNETENGGKPLFQAADEPNIDLMPAQQALDGARSETLKPLWVLMLAVGLILLIACANIGGLLLARATSRTREIAVRLTLGARRTRLVMQLLMESLMLSAAGGALGILLWRWASRLFFSLTHSGDSQLPFTPQLDARVLAFTLVISLFTALLFGLAPILHSLRVDLTPALKTGSGTFETGSTRRRWYGMGNMLVVAQVTLALVALVSAGLLVRTLRNLKAADLGFDANNVLVFSINPTLAGYKPTEIAGLYGELESRFATLPGVNSVSYSWASLLGNSEWDTDFHPPGTPDQTKADSDVFPIGPGFFEVMRLPLKAGRDFTSADFAIQAQRAALPPGKDLDPKSAPLPAIVNETFVKRFFPNTNPIGQHLEEALPEEPGKPRGPGWLVIGVAGDAKYDSLRRDIAPTMYVPWVGNGSFCIRASTEPKQLVPAIRDIVTRRDPNLAMYRVFTEAEQIDRQVFIENLVAQLSSFFAVLALVLACAGIYGLLSYEVARRTREIGIRMAIGAQRTHVVSMVVRHGLGLALVGAIVGSVAAIAVTRLLESLLYGVKPGDFSTLIAVAALLVLVSLVACYLPARRATRVDPLDALRYE